MAFSFECFAVTHIGNRRKNNEDNFYIGDGALLTREEQMSMSLTENTRICKSLVHEGTANLICAVSDGMGGYKDGEEASFIVVDALDGFNREHRQKPNRRRQDKFAYIQNFQKMIDETNLKILKYADSNNETENMGATLTGLIFFADEAVPFNIGDSSVFLYENGILQKLTTDDNEASVFDGADPKELKKNGKLLTKYFGLPMSNGILTAAIPPPISLRQGQLYLVASDGLTDNLTSDDIAKIVKAEPGVETAVNELVMSALGGEAGGRDNITIVMIKVKKTM